MREPHLTSSTHAALPVNEICSTEDFSMGQEKASSSRSWGRRRYHKDPFLVFCFLALWSGLPIQSFTATTFSPSARTIGTRPLKRNRIHCASQKSNCESELSSVDLTEGVNPNNNLHNTDRQKYGREDKINRSPASMSRRSSLQGLLLSAAGVSAASIPTTASAGKPELDTYGNLFSPKADMLSGGSSAARGISTRPTGKRLKPGQALQTVYETRFIAYLSRFLLNFDPAANAWWRQNGFQDSWDTLSDVDQDMAKFKFAEFAESVEFGLADYFVGPYGSYSSVQAAKAGILASAPARSVQPKSETSFLDELFSGGTKKEASKKKKAIDSKPLGKYGVLNLYSLLKARYTSIAAKRQLAILFTFISLPGLQPTAEIRGLLGEADNATISEISVLQQSVKDEEKSRTSSRRGGGYSITSIPEVIVEPPPALGDDYRPAVLRPIMKPTSRVLRIKIIDQGEGYTAAPQVSIQFTGSSRTCQACTIIDRQGHVSEVIVLDPGYGYGGRKGTPPKIKIASPKQETRKSKNVRQAKAIAELEYAIDDIQLVSGGNGYIKNEPPRMFIEPPLEDPDWFLAAQEQPEMRMIPVRDIEPLKVEVNEMRNSDGNVVFTGIGKRQGPTVNKGLISRLKRNPLELLPSTVSLEKDELEDEPLYRVASLPPIPPNVYIPSPRYRAYDPIFGGVGSVPVTKGAVALSASEYARLALSGAVCTVLVRTALNPLELIKTKQQLENDAELFEYARQRLMRQKTEDDANPKKHRVSGGISPADLPSKVSSDTPSEGGTALAVKEQTLTAGVAEVKLGTSDLILSLIELRGFLALFQSADITFLASLVFGSFGFGATELFRRSFTAFFFSDATGGPGGSEIALLFAAALATIITSAAATPFEVLRVKSMILLEPTEWTRVLQSFIQENGQSNNSSNGSDKDFRLSELNPRDLLPLWSGFPPTVSRELPFAIAKFLAFDILARSLIGLINSQTQEGALPIQIGVGPVGLTVSAVAGAVAGVAAAVVSHPADLILTYTSVSKRKSSEGSASQDAAEPDNTPSWVAVVKDLVSREGGPANLFRGLPARATFFFLVIGLQFFLYDYVKGLFQVGTDDLSLVLDVFYSVRAGLLEME